jgi:hypothetical protein
LPPTDIELALGVTSLDLVTEVDGVDDVEYGKVDAMEIVVEGDD